MKAPVGLLSDRTVLRSKMEGFYPDKFRTGKAVRFDAEDGFGVRGFPEQLLQQQADAGFSLAALAGHDQHLLRLGRGDQEIAKVFLQGGYFKERTGNKPWQIGKKDYNKTTGNASVQQKEEKRMGRDMGDRIVSELRRNNMTQKELAERVGATEAAISRYISGAREPKPESIANIATALHTTSDYLLGIEDEAYSHPKVRRMIARNASKMTEDEKRELINALFGEGE